MRTLPHTYRDVDGAEGVAVWFHISGEAGGDWSLLCHAGKWQLCSGEAPDAAHYHSHHRGLDPFFYRRVCRLWAVGHFALMN